MRSRPAVLLMTALVAIAAGRATASPITGDDARIVTRTLHVEAIAVSWDTAWVATRGGLEKYSLSERRRVRLYTTAHGLASTHVHGVSLVGDAVWARTEGHACRLDRAHGERFVCEPAPALPVPEPAVARQLQGARVTARAAIVGGELVGTAGRGLWLVDHSFGHSLGHSLGHSPGDSLERASAHATALLSPGDQVCSNHVMAMAEHQGRLYLGSFDEGLCVTTGHGFRHIETPFRMINDLETTPAGLYVAASEGLFLSVDGEHFERVEVVTERGINGLAFDGQSLYVTSPAALWRIRVAGGPKTRAFWLPGGSRAVQKVAVAQGSVWLASEDRGVIRLSGNTFTVLDRAAGLPTSWVMDVAAAADGTLYAATFRHGLVAIEIDQAGLPRVRAIAGLPDTWLLHVSAHGPALWVGTQGGAARLVRHASAGEQVTHVVAPTNGQAAAALPHPCVHAIARFGNATWLATEGGLYILPPEPSGSPAVAVAR